jgi:hypothetical protein
MAMKAKRASVTHAAGRRAGHPQPGPLNRLLTGHGAASVVDWAEPPCRANRLPAAFI